VYSLQPLASWACSGPHQSNTTITLSLFSYTMLSVTLLSLGPGQRQRIEDDGPHFRWVRMDPMHFRFFALEDGFLIFHLAYTGHLRLHFRRRGGRFFALDGRSFTGCHHRLWLSFPQWSRPTLHQWLGALDAPPPEHLPSTRGRCSIPEPRPSAWPFDTRRNGPE